MAMAAAPNPLSAYSVYKGVTLRWAKIANAKSYTVCYTTAAFANTTCPNAIAVAASVTQSSIGNLVNNRVYYFRVKATNTSNLTVVSDQASSIPIVGKLNDTGITTCANYSQNNLPCPVVTGFMGQDAHYGRDKVFPGNGDGYAGFSFTKMSATGAALPASATSWNCVKDNVTGLMWEIKTDDGGLHDKDNTYSWYEPNNTKNGGLAGYQNGGSCFGSACDTNAYVKAVNTAGWCGYKDWRMPNKEELYSIVDYGHYNPAINTAYFPKTVSDAFWSSSANFRSFSAWWVRFSSGRTDNFDKAYSTAIRLVRGGQ
jgi:hypothetical protein